MIHEHCSLLEFISQEEVSRFQSIDDRVMGGISQSRILKLENNTALFTGIVSTENNGGFASVRSELAVPCLSQSKGVLFKNQRRW